MAREQLSKFNVVATYPDMEAARKAFGALEAAGIDGDDMSLLGPHADAAAAELETRERDAHLVGDVGEHVAKGGAIGSVAGALARSGAVMIPRGGPRIRGGRLAATPRGGPPRGALRGVA